MSIRLTEHDASFLYSESASGPMHISSIYVLDGEAPFERIFAHFQARMHLVPRYLQRLALVPFNLGHPKWVDDQNFDLSRHVVQHRLPEGSSMDQAVSACLELNEQLLDRERPLWKTYVVQGVPGRTLLLQLIHHAMIDGVSGIELTMVLYDFDRDAADPPPPRQAWRPEPAPTALELATEAMRENVEALSSANPLELFRAEGKRAELLRRAAATMGRFFSKPAITAPWNAGLVGPRRELRWSKFSFAQSREIRRAFGGTINDLVLALVSEAAARYLDAHDEVVKDGHFRLMCPVSVRREDEQGALGNRVSAIFPYLPAWPMDVLERLRAVCEEMERIKQNEEAQALSLMQESTVPVPPVAMAPTLLVGTRFDPTVWAARLPMPVLPRLGRRPPYYGFNFTCTNVPGVQVPQYMVGLELIDTIGILMLTGTLGFGTAVTSYNQHLYFNFVCDPRLMPDLELMSDGVQQVFDELLTAARSANAAAAGPDGAA